MKQNKKDLNLFYYENGQREDAKLHEPILAAGDNAKVTAIGRTTAKRLGLTEAELKSLYDQ